MYSFKHRVLKSYADLYKPACYILAMASFLPAGYIFIVFFFSEPGTKPSTNIRIISGIVLAMWLIIPDIAFLGNRTENNLTKPKIS